MYCLWAYQEGLSEDTKNAYLGTAVAFSIIFVFLGIILLIGVGRGSIREGHIRDIRHGYRRLAVGDSRSIGKNHLKAEEKEAKKALDELPHKKYKHKHSTHQSTETRFKHR